MIRILFTLIAGLMVIGCRRDETATVVVEVNPFVPVKVRESGRAVDISKAKIVGEATASERKEVAGVIGRIVGLESGKVDYVRFTRRHDGLEVDFARGHELITMRKVQGKWVVYATGGLF